MSTHRRAKHACICSGSSSFTHTSHGVKYSYCTVPTVCHPNQSIWPWSIKHAVNIAITGGEKRREREKEREIQRDRRQDDSMQKNRVMQL